MVVYLPPIQLKVSVDSGLSAPVIFQRHCSKELLIQNMWAHVAFSVYSASKNKADSSVGRRITNVEILRGWKINHTKENIIYS